MSAKGTLTMANELVEALKALKKADKMLVDSLGPFGTYSPQNVVNFHLEAKHILDKYPNLK